MNPSHSAEPTSPSDRRARDRAPAAAAALAAGEQCFEEGDDAAAVTHCRTVLAVDPADADANHLLARITARLGNPALARNLMASAIRADPAEPDFCMTMGDMLYEQGAYRGAVALFRKAAVLAPERGDAWYNLGNAWYAGGSPQGAVGAFIKAAGLEPDNADAHYNLGVAYMDLNRRRAAAGAFARAATAAPMNPRAHYNLGLTRHLMGETDKARAALEAALRLDPQYAAAHAALGNLHQEQGDLDKAAAAFRRAVALQPDFADAWFNLGNALKRADAADEAEAAYRNVLALRPRDSDALFNLHAMVFDDRDPEPARDCLRQALEADPGHGLARFYLGVAEDVAGDAAAADAAFTAFDSQCPDQDFLTDSWSYVREHRTPETRIFADSYRTLRFALDAASVSGMVAEFGVSQGHSLRVLARHAGQTVHGFDSFLGLPEAWGSNPAGTYSTGGHLPAMPGNAQLHRGWFADTLPDFADSHEGPLRLANIDCDLYSATVTVFAHLGTRMVSGTVLVFDEYICNAQWREDEFRAFQEFMAARPGGYTYLAFNPFTKQAVVRLD